MTTDLEAFGVAVERALGDQRTARDLAAAVGKSPQLISDWIGGRKRPSVADAIAVEDYLGVAPGTLTVHLGFLPPGTSAPPPGELEDAVIGDPRLTGRQKRVLLQLIGEFTTALE